MALRRFVLAAAAVALLVPFPASAKSFDYDRIGVDIVVARDGSFRVSETRTYDFEGSFSFAFVQIDPGPYDMLDARVSESTRRYDRVNSGSGAPGTFTFDGSRIQWYFRAADERRTFTVSYRIAGHIVAHDDVAEFVWKFLGDDRGAGASDVVVTMTLPAGALRAEIRAWGHGPLEGEVRVVDDRSIRWELASLDATDLFEGRVTFPPSLVPGAPRKRGDRLPAILAIEQGLADEANDARRRARIWNIAPPIAALGSLGLFAWLFVRYGREPKAADPGPYLRELPTDDPPAIVGYLMRWGNVGATDMVATLMDLARRGYLRIDEIRGEKGLLVRKPSYDYRISIVREPDASLRGFEREIIDLLRSAMAVPPDITDDELNDWAEANPALMQASMHGFVEKVREHGRSLGLIQSNVGVIGASVGAVVLAAAIAVIGFGEQNAGTDPIGRAPGSIIAFGLLAPQVALTGLLRRRTVRGASAHRRWLAFKRFLTDLTRLEEYRPSAVVMWEQYLVYAVALGVAKEVSEALRLHAPAEVQTAGFGWYAFSSHGGAATFGDSIATFTESFTASAATAFATAPSSGGGAGGGFSGGGGGGGGGGGSSGAG